MKQVTISLYHEGCWGSEVTKDFFGVRFKQLTSHYSVIKKTKDFIESQGVWEITVPNEDTLIKFLEALRKHQSIINLEIVSSNASKAVVFMHWKVPYSPYEVLTSHGCIPTEPVVIENGIEYHTFLGEDEAALREALDIIKKTYDSKIIRIGKFIEKKNGFGLTEKQQSALDTAIKYGYYSWPRAVTIDDLATAAKVSRKVFADHLRKAESKIIPAMLAKGLGKQTQVAEPF